MRSKLRFIQRLKSAYSATFKKAVVRLTTRSAFLIYMHFHFILGAFNLLRGSSPVHTRIRV